MGQLVFQATLGGQVNLVGPNTASTFNINVPAVAGNMVTTGDTGTVTNTMLASSAYTAPGTIGSGTPNTGAFTTLSASSTVSGTGFITYLASPPAIGGTAAASGSFTALSYTTTLTGGTGIVNLGSGQFYKDASGNVGIGTSSPAARLDINSGSAALTADFNSTSADGLYLRFRNSGTTIGDIGSGKSVFNGTAGDFAVGSRAGSLVLGTGSTERARIDSSGNLLVGKTSTSWGANGASLLSRGSILIDSSSDYGLEMGGATTSRVKFYSSAGSNTTTVGSITVSGSATTYATSSDYRLKENVAPMTGALSVVSALKPCTYTWKSDGSDGQGFIAHELQEVVPDAVVGEKDAVDAEGNPQYQGIDTSFLVATLTAAIQEQQALITTLTERITSLEAPKV